MLAGDVLELELDVLLLLLLLLLLLCDEVATQEQLRKQDTHGVCSTLRSTCMIRQSLFFTLQICHWFVTQSEQFETQSTSDSLLWSLMLVTFVL